ncbi:HDOD domain-containing protein [Candidatus Magnetomonas plexicatena]|uniref:HDOD domain-containing protein n=1 Tax=Candidatus Magnetomonas plexicatena TaxID=2552947 RepID=UPI0011001CCC|nr:HDOD domain-containing protein [Nitrospirales bacterium LBB_01]
MTEKKEDSIGILRKRLQESSDFPALSRAVTMVSQKASKHEVTSIHDLTGDILDDISITNKLLKKVNTFAYASAQSGGKIDTISRAVFVVGFEKVKNIAMSLLLFESLKDKNSAMRLKEEILGSYLSGSIAREMAGTTGIRNTEEIFIYSIFHNLGRLLVTFLMPYESQKIKHMMEKKKISEQEASRTVLGKSYEDIGAIIAEDWSFSNEMILTMKPIKEKIVPAPRSESDKKHAIVCFSNEMSRIMMSTDAGNAREDFALFIKRYKGCFDVSRDKIAQIADISIHDLSDYMSGLDPKVASAISMEKLTANVEQLRELDENTIKKAAVKKPEPEKIRPLYSSEPREMPQDAVGLLNKGIADISKYISDGRSFNDILNAIIQVMYNAMGFSRVIFGVKNTADFNVVGRYGLGDNIKQIIPDFNFKLSGGSDVFNLVMSKRSDIIIQDINDPNVRSRIPDWYRKLFDSETFMLLHVTVDDRPIGIIYADKPNAGDIKIPQALFTSLKILRDHLLMAIKKSHNT